MEPFGLFHFLQSLLNSTAPNEIENPVEERETTPEQTEEIIPPKENACARFLENHDARARRMKKL